MLHYSILALLLACLCVSPSSCRLSKDELAAAVDAFDGFVEVPKSKHAKDKIELQIAEHEQVEAPVLDLQPAVEEVFIKEEAHCTGCPYDLNISAPDVIDMAKNALSTIADGNTYTLIRLLKANAEVENGYVYNLKLEANRCFENVLCSNVSCILELKNKYAVRSQPEVTYFNCVEPN